MHDSEGQPTIEITRAQLTAWAGRELTDDEVSQLDDAVPNSSIPDAIDAIVASFPTHDPAPAEPYADDRATLAAILDIVRRHQPTATEAHFTTSAHDRYGFQLTDVRRDDDTLLSLTAPGTLDTIHAEVADRASNLRWRGILHEDKYGNATVQIPRPAAPDLPSTAK